MFIMLKTVQRLWMNSRSSNLQSRSTFTSINVITITEKTMKQTLQNVQHAICLQLIKLIKIIQSIIQLKNYAQVIKTLFYTFPITLYLSHLSHKSQKKNFQTKRQGKSWTGRLSFQIQFKKLISRYVILPFLYSKSKFTDLSEISSALSSNSFFTDGCNNGPIGLQSIEKERGENILPANRDFIESFRNSDI